MLDSDTKQRINAARDVLVGIIPDPKSQVEQITIALIYKFMDDMDAQSKAIGGKPSFFVGEFKKYSWAALMDTATSGHEMLSLYSDAITRMSENPKIPSLFRNIFKNAHLPHRNPETLRMFLKIIGEFEYDHSERLGDAFEYLLSVMGAQGDAGQFRTPRHIIDFMVKAVNPRKDEVILDPACGTAGFLISSYKHILEENSKNGRAGAALSPSARKKIIGNIKGYDISPDMVRLSLVNLYLHGFSDPHIAAYDTLTSEDKWEEYADVILANPPFMSPRGGIIPHNRYSVSSKRAEALFVDYIAEHLTPRGRAAVIVPEGIIFQSQNAYKQLREMLIKEYLYAVVSLPAGVFNPYSGVKTSILFMDKILAQKTDSLLFVTVENDGYDLGARRRKTDKDDLPTALEIIKRFQQEQKADGKNRLCHVVKKEKIGEDGEWNLSGERYREEIKINTNFPIVELGQIADINAGNSAPQDTNLYENGKYYFCRTSDVGKVHLSANFSEISNLLNEEGIKGLKLFKKGTILFPKSGASTFLNHRVRLSVDSYVSSHLATIYGDYKKIDSLFLYHMLCNVDARNLTNNQNYPSLKLSQIQKVKIPLPPLEIQKEIVAEIEKYQKIIDGARTVVENYMPQIEINPDWEEVGLGKLEQDNKIQFLRGAGLSKKDITTNGKNKSIHYGELYTVYEPIIKYVKSKTNYHGKIFSCIGDVLMPSTTTADALGIAIARSLNENGVILGADLNIIRTHNKYVLSDYLALLISNSSVKNRLAAYAKGANILHLSNKDIKKIKIPLPPLDIQKQIVSRIENEQALVNANKQLITIYEQKIKDKIAAVWDN